MQDLIDPEDLHPGLRSLLNGWDPVAVRGAVDNPPDDEYDRLGVLVARRLTAGDGPQELTSFLEREMQDKFGLDPALLGIPRFAEKVSVWFEITRRRR